MGHRRLRAAGRVSRAWPLGAGALLLVLLLVGSAGCSGREPAASGPAASSASAVPPLPGTLGVCDARDRGLITLEAVGTGSLDVELTVCRRAPGWLSLSAPVGTFFRPVAARQRLMAWRPAQVVVPGEGQTALRVEALCCNRHLPCPFLGDRLVVLPAPPDERLCKLAALLAREQVDERIAQTAVWALTDDPGLAAESGGYTPTIFSPALWLLHGGYRDPGMSRAAADLLRRAGALPD